MISKVYKKMCVEEYLNNVNGKTDTDDELITSVIDFEIDGWEELFKQIEGEYPYICEQIDIRDLVYFYMTNFPKPGPNVVDVKAFIDDGMAVVAESIINYLKGMDSILALCGGMED